MKPQSLFLAFLIIFSLLLFGCTSSKPADSDSADVIADQPSDGGADTSDEASEEKSETMEKPESVEQPEPPVEKTEEPLTLANYNKVGISFDYPVGMGMQESLNDLTGDEKIGVGNIWLGFGDYSATIFVLYSNSGNLDNTFNNVQDLATNRLNEYITAGNMPMLKDATDKSELQTVTTDKGIGVAHLSFKYPTESGTNDFGHAIQFSKLDNSINVFFVVGANTEDLSSKLYERLLSSFDFK